MVEDELMREFLVDRVELFELVDEALLFLERHPDDPPALNAVFRSVHTVKGTAGMLGLGPLEVLFQRGEDLRRL
jgi:two-component system, chemotaxis family, sensor kinase CheA